MYGEYGVLRRAFADALKEDMGQNLIQGGAWEKEWYAYRGDLISFVDSIKHHAEIRALLQNYGVAQRKAQPDYWIQRLLRWITVQEVGHEHTGKRLGAVIVPDVRFRNEAQAIKDRGGLLIRVNRPGYDNGLSLEAQGHPSETDLDNWGYFDYYVHNDGGMERIRQQLQGNLVELYIRKGLGYAGVGRND